MSTPPAPSRAETPIAFIAAMVQAYAQRGMDPTAALQKAQIAPNLLNQPQARVTALQMEWMSEAAMRELDDEALGWFRRRLPWGSYGMLVRASLTAPTLGVALARWCRHHNLLTDDIRLTLSTADGLAHIDLHEAHDLQDLREFCTVSVLR
ncbi:MAG: AraC family transcriptional regulator, partial [Limnohabitans sp.]|nr:AraC family transcriptional regulator [Limnohabitans sp.]